jgi:hypothetical protein
LVRSEAIRFISSADAKIYYLILFSNPDYTSKNTRGMAYHPLFFGMLSIIARQHTAPGMQQKEYMNFRKNT